MKPRQSLPTTFCNPSNFSGFKRLWRASLTTIVQGTACLRRSSDPRTTTKSEHTNVSKCLLPCFLRFARLLNREINWHLPFRQCAAARNMLDGAGDLKRKWTWAVEWLHDELERGGGHRWPTLNINSIGNRTWKALIFRAPYANTASSNETANGYFLERSHSARLTLEKACELMPEEEVRKMGWLLLDLRKLRKWWHFPGGHWWGSSSGWGGGSFRREGGEQEREKGVRIEHKIILNSPCVSNERSNSIELSNGKQACIWNPFCVLGRVPAQVRFHPAVKAKAECGGGALFLLQL